MHAPLRIRQLQALPLAIPMRLRFEHAAASRDTADPVVVRLTGGAPYAHLAGYGETLARPYVTGETTDTVLDDIRQIFAPRLRELCGENFAVVLEAIDALPNVHEGRVVAAARAAVELALIDLAGKVFRRRAAEVAGWMGLPGFGPPGCLEQARYSGIVVGSGARLAWILRAQRLYGLRDFKIKVATDGWEEKLRRAARILRGPIERERATLRADANGGWTYEQVCDAIPLLERCGVSALEQPMREQDDPILPDIASRTEAVLVADESLVTLDDARRLLDIGGVRVFNIRIGKNGGLMPALRLARLAIQNGVDVQLGCLVGETSILSAAGAAFLEACPRVRFVEGAFGRRLLKDDVGKPSIQFGFRGRVRARSGFGLGVSVDDAAVQRLAAGPGVNISF